MTVLVAEVGDVRAAGIVRGLLRNAWAISALLEPTAIDVSTSRSLGGGVLTARCGVPRRAGADRRPERRRFSR